MEIERTNKMYIYSDFFFLPDKAQEVTLLHKNRKICFLDKIKSYLSPIFFNTSKSVVTKCGKSVGNIKIDRRSERHAVEGGLFLIIYVLRLIFQVSIALKFIKSEKDKLCFEVDEVLVRFNKL